MHHTAPENLCRPLLDQGRFGGSHALPRQSPAVTSQVLSALVHVTEQAASWEAGGRQGPQPTYAASSALVSAALAPPRDPDRPPQKKKKKPQQAAGGGGSTGVIPQHQILPLAAQLVGRLLLGAGSGAGGPLDGVVQLLLQQYRLPQETALRQALLASVQGPSSAAAGALIAATAGGGTAALPPVTVAQYQAAVSVMTGMLCQLSVACGGNGGAHGAGSGTDGGGGGSSKALTKAPSAAGSASGSGGKRAAATEGGAAGGPKPPKKPRLAGAYALGDPREGGRAGSASVNKAPQLICFACQAGVLQEGGLSHFLHQPVLCTACCHRRLPLSSRQIGRSAPKIS
jgi:hypothetical protein